MDNIDRLNFQGLVDSAQSAKHTQRDLSERIDELEIRMKLVIAVLDSMANALERANIK